MAQLTGKARIVVNGVKFATENGAKLNTGGVNRKPERHGGTTHYVEEEVPPSIDGVLLHTPDADIISVKDIVDATVYFECDNGHKFVLRDAFVTDTAELDSGTGKVPFKMSAQSCDKM